MFGEEELLEHEPDAYGPQCGELPVGQVGDVEPGDAYRAAGGSVQGAHDLQQGRLARTGRPDDRDQLAGADLQAQCRSAVTGGSVG